LPEALNDRAQDSWELLIAIAEVAGGEWPQKAREAALALSGGAEPDDSARTQLLADIRSVFEEKECERITSEALVGALVAMPDKPWRECNRGKELTQNLLARRLKPFGIAPKTMRTGTGTPKGYLRESLEESFNRYLPLNTTFQTATPQQISNINDLSENQTATLKDRVAVSKSIKYNDFNAVVDVAVENPQKAGIDEEAGHGVAWGCIDFLVPAGWGRSRLAGW
jgi:Protein of unknown function (DUF3631)